MKNTSLETRKIKSSNNRRVLAKVKEAEDSIKKKSLEIIKKKCLGTEKTNLRRKLYNDHKVVKKSKQDSEQNSIYCDDSDDNKDAFAISVLKGNTMEVT